MLVFLAGGGGLRNWGVFSHGNPPFDGQPPRLTGTHTTSLTPVQIHHLRPTWTDLAFNPSLATSTRFWVTIQSTVTTTLFPWQADGSKFLLLFSINAVDPRSPQQGPSPFGGQRLQEEVIIDLHVFHINIFIGNIIQCQAIGLHRLHRPILGQLPRDRKERLAPRAWSAGASSQGGMVQSSTMQLRFPQYEIPVLPNTGATSTPSTVHVASATEKLNFKFYLISAQYK